MNFESLLSTNSDLIIDKIGVTPLPAQIPTICFSSPLSTKFPAGGISSKVSPTFTSLVKNDDIFPPSTSLTPIDKPLFGAEQIE